MMRHVGVIVALAASAASATTTSPAPLPPPYAGVYHPIGTDEIGLWREDDERERALATSPLVIHDEALTTYITTVLCLVVGSDRCNATRVYVIRTPLVNASMSPNGTMRVYSGLLLRMRNEAELGSVLGHEFGHFERRHTLQLHKAARSGSNLLAWGAVLASMSNSPYARQNFSTLELSVYGDLSRYSRDNERDADLLGLGYLNASTYRPQAAAVVWHNVMAESEASARMRGLKKPRFDQVAFFASHPPDAEREAYLSALAVPQGATRDLGATRYAAAMAKWMPVFLDDQIKLNDFGASEYVIEMLAEGGWTAPLWYARGELYRTRGAQRDLANAADFYAAATKLDPAMADAYRGLGLALLKTGRPSEARVALQRYLELKPAASDSAMITMTLSSIGTD